MLQIFKLSHFGHVLLNDCKTPTKEILRNRVNPSNATHSRSSTQYSQTIMADASGSAPPTEAVANLHLDEVTGEKVSKSELKKRQKNRQKEEEKKKKEAAAPPKPAAPKKSNAEADEKELNPNV